jgi:hypothetical protein
LRKTDLAVLRCLDANTLDGTSARFINESFLSGKEIRFFPLGKSAHVSGDSPLIYANAKKHPLSLICIRKILKNQNFYGTIDSKTDKEINL